MYIAMLYTHKYKKEPISKLKWLSIFIALKIMTITCSHLGCDQDDSNQILCRRSFNSQSCHDLIAMTRTRGLDADDRTFVHEIVIASIWKI